MQKQLKVNLFYNAGQTTYTIPFDFLQKKFIGVKYLPSNYSVLDIDKATPLVYGKDYTVDNKTLTLNQAGDSSKIINIYRETPTDSLVGFTDGSILKADNLNLFDTQILHITEELADYFIIHDRKITTTDDVQNIYIVDSLPDSAVPSDIAIIRSTKCMYQFINNKWELIATPKAQYLLDYETLIKRNETSKTGEANKISFANSEGKLPNNITGSPDKILNKEIDKSTVPTEGTFFVFRNNKFCLEKTIDDSKLSETTTYSSQKIDDTFLHKNGDTVNGNLNITGTITGTLKGNADTATKALQDISGQQIDKTYIKNLNTVDDNIIFTKGDGTNTNKTVNNVKNSIKALQDTRGQQIDVTYIKNLDVNGNQLTVTRGNGTVESFAVSGGDGAVIEEYIRKLVGVNDTLTVIDGNGVTTEIKINNVANATKATQDKNGNDITTYLRHAMYNRGILRFIKGDNTSLDVEITTVPNAGNASFDSLGQEISSTYVKGVANNFDQHQHIPILNQLSITKGDDTQSIVTIDDVDHAKNVDKSCKFVFDSNGIEAKYKMFAKMYAGNETDNGNCTLIISSVGDFGDNIIGTYMVNISNRGNTPTMSVIEIFPDKSNKVKFGYYIKGNEFYFGFYCATYCAETGVTVLSESKRQGDIRNYGEYTEAPANWTETPIIKLAKFNTDNHLVMPNGAEFWIG